VRANPGTWRCIQENCGSVNPSRAVTCRRCGAAVGRPTSGSSPPTSGRRASRAGAWICPKGECRNVNFSFRDLCNRCGTTKPNPVPTTGTDSMSENAPSPPPALWFPAQTLSRHSRKSTLKTRWSPPGGSWKCSREGCENINFPSRIMCHRCGHPQVKPNGGPPCAVDPYPLSPLQSPYFPPLFSPTWGALSNTFHYTTSMLTLSKNM
jgi:ribosomal protein S27E